MATANTTLREELIKAGLDWPTARIVYWETTGYSPGWSSGDEVGPPVEIEATSDLLDKEFYPGHGSPQCPRFIAFDAEAVYFPSQYDGASWVERVETSIERYLLGEIPSPYPGG